MTAAESRPLGSRYRLTDRIGRGGMGEVWQGTDSDGQRFAFKLLQPQYAEDPEVIRRFLAERHLLTSVRHPNVVGMHDMVIEGATLAIVMDLVEGTDLRHHLRERGTLPAAEACRLAAQIASGMGAIHARRIVHRDIKPENILLDLSVDPPTARLTDFGVARLLEDDTEASKPTVLAGTPRYMAPEVINGEIPTPRSDLYALGLVLYELLCGVTPFTGLSTGPLMQAHLTMDPGRPDGIDDRIWQLISQLVSKDPSKRPGDAGAVALRLERLREVTAGQPALDKLAAPPPPVPAASQHQTRVSLSSEATQLASPQASFPPQPADQPRLLSQLFGPGASQQPGQSQPSFVPGSSYPPGQSYPSYPPGQSYPSYPPGQSYPSYPSIVPGQPVAHGAPASPSRNRTPVLAGVIAGLVVIVVVLALAVSLGNLGLLGGDGGAGSSAVTTPPASTAESAPAPTTEEPSPPPTTQQPPTTAPPPPAWPPPGTTLCHDALAVNESTSCSFAFNVADAYYAHPGATVQAYSPVTQQTYTMSCSAVQASIVLCTGGTNAVVYLRQ